MIRRACVPVEQEFNASRSLSVIAGNTVVVVVVVVDWDNGGCVCLMAEEIDRDRFLESRNASHPNSQ
jgi:hypothetical protein